MFGRRKTVKEEQAARGKESVAAQQQQQGQAAHSGQAGTPYVQRYAGNAYGAQEGGSLPNSARMVSVEEYQRLRELLESKCDEVDDLSNNLKLAKDSLRQVPGMPESFRIHGCMH